MQELTLDEIDQVSGAFNWESAGNACLAAAGVAAICGQPEIAVGCAIAAAVCFAKS